MGQLKIISKIDVTNKTRISLQGAMDESSDYSKLQSTMGKEVTVDFDHVEHINSVGIKHWVQWVEALVKDKPELKFRFINCPKSIVDQINMVEGFLPKGSVVQSFKVPFYCEECDESQTATFLEGREYSLENNQLNLQIPKLKCSQCNNEEGMEMDVVEKKYFRFLEK